MSSVSPVSLVSSVKMAENKNYVNSCEIRFKLIRDQEKSSIGITTVDSKTLIFQYTDPLLPVHSWYSSLAASLNMKACTKDLPIPDIQVDCGVITLNSILA